MSCWCGVRNPYFATLAVPCGGTGILYCICGGDFCVCHNHGEMECDGCPDCEFEEMDDYSADFEDWVDASAP